jgi:hypothetical protein
MLGPLLVWPGLCMLVVTLLQVLPLPRRQALLLLRRRRRVCLMV